MTPKQSARTETHPVLNADDLATLLGEIETASLVRLRAIWTTHCGPPPHLRSVALLRLVLAWRLQANALGGLSRDVRRKLRASGRLRAEGLELGVGARLRREWKGHMQEVVVEEHGFRWDGTLYPSLSAAATAIAGSRWNGPRFFGLRNTGK